MSHSLAADLRVNDMNALQERCKQATVQASRIYELMPVMDPASERHRLARCAVALAMEHHVSIITLVSLGNYSTAAALLRPLMEAGACAFWLVYSCPPESFQLIMDGKRDTPTLPEMVRRLARVPGLESVKKLAEILPREGRYLDSYTHGGMSQIGQRDWKTPFDSDRNMHTVMAADMFVLAGAALATVIYQAGPLFEYLGSRREEIRLEISQRSGEPVPHDPWRPFPIPTLA